MASAAQYVRRERAGRVVSAGEAVPVILDGGGGATVALIDLESCPYLGMRFEHGGTVWEVTHAKDHLRGWVARPAAGAGCAAS